jgi:hypothetical protein
MKARIVEPSAMASLACSAFALAKGGGKRAYSNSIPYTQSTLKTLQEIFKVSPLLGAAAYPETIDLSDLFKQ